MPRDLQQTPIEERRSITDSLIAQRNLSCPAEKETPESISKALASLLTIRLDRENICAISNLQGLREVRSLYLQENQIETIENLSCLPNLRFLSLAGNRIRVVENLQDLRQLQFLDLSQNRIETLDPDELPWTLCILNLSGNRCTHQNGYRELVLGALPHLMKLDTQLVPSWRDPDPAEEEEGASDDSDSEEDDDVPELTGPFCADKEFFAGLRQELAGRSQRRRQEALSEHQARLEELTERQRLMQLPGDLGPGSRKGPEEEGASGGRSPAPGLLEMHPKSGSRLLSLPKAGGSTRSGTPRAGGQSKRGSGARLKPPKGEASTIVKTAARAAKK
ncbi:leucine-rich repeat-containing protein 46 [Gopherus evgoodei]|uniref:Leucine rich repeat containing 46 n=1 Tax=Gopherus evgoodei TaxID=1825980 RepID=A0A8C4YFY8_9SAUR|nr:leucine-rich repeat-containing protein 46 [Gopherus evgoodei]